MKFITLLTLSTIFCNIGYAQENYVYVDAPLGQKHALIREVFKDGFTYKNGCLEHLASIKI